MHSLFNSIFTTNFGFSILRVTTPILFAALGALISDRAGIVNIGLEGIMLFSALAGVLGSAYSHSVIIGLLSAMITGMVIAGILGYFTLHFKTDVILGGIAVNLFADGGSVFLLYLFTHDKGTSASLPSKVVPSLKLPLIDQIPVVGKIISGHNILTYVSILSVIAIYYLLKKTSLGLRIRSVGENPNAAQSVGISVMKVQYIAIILSGLLAGLGGAYMSMGYVSWFSRNMTAGRGWIALAAEAVGRGTTLGTALASLLFGAADALANTLQVLKVPEQLVSTVPYIATIIGLMFYAIKETNKKKIQE
ncbi:ABC transporter permease [Clostridium oryzae]|uniref:L-arabinose transporter permease protein n=1 Tax=Clostridium oryzae TaxID=1450648 RepID=A0A1V4IJN5_9CLOT|nr:ABC transporter permease [Clostridium oryzae]OPJ60211.1 L-arabinose transporter permease protein [Clostridium oryzae]